MLYKKHFLVLTCFLLILVVNSTAQLAYNDITKGQRTSIFNDAFDNNNNKWITDNSWISGKFNNGFYELACKNYNQQTGLSYLSISVDKSKDYEIETSFKVIKGSGALVFGLTKEFDHFRVEIDNKKNVIFAKDSPSRNKAEKLFSANIKSIKDPGFYNKITIRKVQNSYYLFLNDQFIKQLNDLVLSGDQVGFSVGTNSGISVDYLNISYLVFQTAPVLAANNPEKTDSVNLSRGNSVKVSPVIKDTVKMAVAPMIKWISPSGQTTSLDTYSARVRAKIKSISDLKSVFFYINGASHGEGEIKLSTDENGTYVAEKTLNLNPGENNVYLIATNLEGSTKSDLRFFTNPQASPPEIKWGVPLSSNGMVNTETFTMEVCIKSLADLISAKVLVDGVQVTVGKVFQKSETENCNYIWKPQIVLKEGDNSIYVIAENIGGSTTSENRMIKLSKTGAEKRLALIFGNSNYPNGTSLKNPVNDANLMEATLKDLGFEVMKQINSTKSEMERAIMEFSQKLPQYNVGLFYYAGHGIQVDGTNYLIPTDAKLQEKVACKWEAISVTDVVSEFEKYPDNINIVILDACRNNPYRSWVRGGEAGFRFITDVSGTIIAYATAEGATAVDGSGANGLYTEELVKQMTVPQPVESVFKKTRVQVEIRSNGSQSPRESSGLRGEFYFKR